MNLAEPMVSNDIRGSIPRSLVTIYDVAEKAGVSTSTVSRILAGFVNYAPETRRRILTVVRDLGYVPNDKARKIASMRVPRNAGIIDRNPKETSGAF